MTTALLDPPLTTPRLTAGRAVTYVVTGLLAGVAYGALLRLWMRYISTDPEFTWAGTLAIVGSFAVLGMNAGLVTAGRRCGWRGLLAAVRTIGIVLSLACFSAAGIVMLPTVVPAGLAIGRHDWPRGVRVALLVLATVVATAVVLTMPDLSLARRSGALVWYLVMCAIEAGLVAALYAPGPRRVRARRGRRPALIGSGGV